MPATWVPLAGVVVFLAVGCWWRSWLQARRYGNSGFLLFRSGRWSQHIRDGLAVVLAIALTGQGLVAGLRPSSLRLLPAFLAESSAIRAIGIALLYGGVVFLVAAQLNLGASWRVGIEEGARAGLVTTGIYRFCRNPIFLAMLITIAGYGLLLPTRLSLILLIAAFIGTRTQILAEEDYLRRTYGDAYRSYARRVGRFLPGIGHLH